MNTFFIYDKIKELYPTNVFIKIVLLYVSSCNLKKNSLLLHIYATMNKNYTVYYVPEWFSLHIHLILTMRIIMLFPFYRSEN